MFVFVKHGVFTTTNDHRKQSALQTEKTLK